MIYSSKGNLLFTHISRCAGTSISNQLYKYYKDATQIVGQHAATAEAKERLSERFEQVFKFCVVRNPWERLASWYALIEKTELEQESDVASLGDPDSEHWQAFDAFLATWLAETRMIEGRQRASQSQWAQIVDANDVNLMDAVCRFEKFSSDLTPIMDKLGIPSEMEPKVNGSVFNHYSQYYSKEGRELVSHFCADDIVHFNYRFSEEKRPEVD